MSEQQKKGSQAQIQELKHELANVRAMAAENTVTEQAKEHAKPIASVQREKLL